MADTASAAPSDADIEALRDTFDWDGWIDPKAAQRAFARAVLALCHAQPTPPVVVEPRELASPERELLEQAAKAINRRITSWNTAQGEEIAVLDDGSFWQPLHRNRITDCHGDAQRLACALEIDVTFRVVGGMRVEALPPGGPLIVEPYSQASDRAAVMCLAITRAAAGFGARKAGR